MKSLAPIRHQPAKNNAPNWTELRRLLDKYSFDDKLHQPYYGYGTAGFRYPATELAPIMVRVGLAAALLSSNSGCAVQVGVMVTASHNTAEYNGVKLAGADGGMLDHEGEEVVARIVNERSVDALLDYVGRRLLVPSPWGRTQLPPAAVHVGRDTRAHSAALACLVRAAAHHAGCAVFDHGAVTTPQLHHAVRHANCAAAGASSGRRPLLLPACIPPRLGVAGYYDLLVHSYVALLATADPPSAEAAAAKERPSPLIVDCACGVGHPHLVALAERLHEATGTVCHIRPVNAVDSGPLNDGCGSEYVQKEQRVCKFYDADSSTLSLDYCAALDGDADRIVFFYVDHASAFHLLDGDKMAVLIGNFVQEQLNEVRADCSSSTDDGSSAALVVSLGVVQTAYANGASTDYLHKQNVAIRLAKTGVKYVHAAAHEHFDVGVYFESNGHGTVVFGDRYYDFLHSASKRVKTRSGRLALQRLSILPSLVNQAVGDALSDLLLIDAILQLQNMTIEQWDKSMYQDLPSRQAKVKVADRTAIVTNDTETAVVQPALLQTEIDAVVATYPKGRAFVRPSGTEDVVRVYAEADTQENADALASALVDIVQRLCSETRSKM
jgi:phosphoacetylglucosamine mutase